jgi:uncharacterized protein
MTFRDHLLSYDLFDHVKLGSRAAESLAISAAAGESDGQFHLGICYFSGYGVEQNFTRASDLFGQASMQGHSSAQNNLAFFCKYGIGKEKDLKNAIKLLYSSHMKSNSVAQYNLGNSFMKGEGVDRDAKKAFDFYTLSLSISSTSDQHTNTGQKKQERQQHPEALNNVGICYQTGQGVEKDIAKAHAFFAASAHHQYSIGQYNLGLCYLYGWGPDSSSKQDFKMAVQCFREAAEQGCAYAQNNLALCLENGIGTLVDLNESIRWYRLSVQQGDAVAHTNLAGCYTHGIGVDKDLIRATQLLTEGSRKGDSIAQYELGLFYFYGYGNCEMDYKKSYDLHLLSVETGQHPGSRMMLGYYHEMGLGGVTKDLEKATEHYWIAAKQNQPQAQFNLATLYESVMSLIGITPALGKSSTESSDGQTTVDKGTSSSSSSSSSIPRENPTHQMKCVIDLLTASAQQGHSGAQFKLGVILAEGTHGQKQDVQKALVLLKASADNNDPRGQVSMGYCYEIGLGVEKDVQRAIEYYILSSDQDNTTAMFNLGSIYYLGKPPLQKHNFGQAVRLWRRAANLGLDAAQNNLGILYAYGYHVKESVEKARYYFKKAADQGNLDAKANLASASAFASFRFPTSDSSLVKLDNDKTKTEKKLEKTEKKKSRGKKRSVIVIENQVLSIDTYEATRKLQRVA